MSSAFYVTKRAAASTICLWAMVLCLGASTSLAAQSVPDGGGLSISGTVTGAEDGLPLPGVNIQVVGTSTGTVTDIDGAYSLTVPGPEAEMRFSYLGYLTQTFTPGDRTTIDVQLSENATQLEGVVVVGYGTQRRSDVSGSVETVEVDDVVTNPSSNVKSLLVGRVPGLLTNQNPGLPGSDNVALSIRGFGNPLVIVDGVESSFDRLDPNDIESVSVLKDASAAIYGARAGNGVILVTTKRGKAGKTRINYHGWVGRQQTISFAEFANAEDYLRLGRGAILNDQFDPENPGAEITYPADFSEERLAQYTSGQAQSYDWADGLIKDNGASIQQHTLSASGGNENIRFYTSLGTMGQDGIFKGDYEYSRVTLTNNLDVKLTDDLDLSFNSSFINENRDYASTSLNDFFTDLRTAQPFYNYALPDPERAPYSGFSERSPAARITQSISGYNRTKAETLAAALELEYRLPFVPGLSVGARVNVRNRSDAQEILRRPYSIYTYEPESEVADAEGYVLQANNNGNASYRQLYYSGDGSPRRRMLSRAFAQYQTALREDHQFKLLVFGEQEDNTFTNLSVERRQLLSYDVPQVSGADDLTSILGASTGRPQDYTRVSFAGRLNYSFRNKYLLEATLRADGSSYFGPDVRWGYFPSVSAGWNISREGFLEDFSALDNLKLRLSYSETGIDANVGRTTFDYLTGFTEAPGVVYYLDGSAIPIIVNQGLANPFITWEQTTLYNAGIDFAFLNGQVYGTFDAFYRLREGLLARPIERFPSTFGADLPLTNLNSRSNRGFDMSLGYAGAIRNFKFTVAGNLGLSREKYERIEEDINPDDPYDVKFNQLSGKFVSETTYGYITDGLFQSQEEVDRYLETYTIEDINGRPVLGDIRYVDVNGDGIIDLNDREQLGYGSFPEMTFGLSTDFQYAGFRLAILFQGASRFNVNIANQARNPFDNERVPLQIHVDHSFYQDPANPGVNANPDAILPAFGRNGAHAWNNNFSDYWYKDATYVRLKNATLSYSLPTTVLDKVRLSRTEFYVSSDNLLMFNRLGIFKGIIDPEEAINNDGFTLPTLRTITLGLRLGL